MPDVFSFHPRNCLRCHQEIDMSAAAEQDVAHPRAPEPGDLSICAYCGYLQVFTATGFREATQEDLFLASRPQGRPS